MGEATTSCTFDKEVLSELKEYLRQPMPIGGFVVGSKQGSELVLLSSIIPYQSLMMTPEGATYFQIDGKEVVHIRNVLNAVRAYFPNTKINMISGFLISKPKQALELMNKDLAMFQAWSGFDKKLVAVLIDSYKNDNFVKVFNSEFREVKISDIEIKFDENDKKAYNFFNWQMNIYYKSKNLQAPAVLIPKRVLQEIEAKQASSRQTTQLTGIPSHKPSLEPHKPSLDPSANLETSKTTERRYDKVERRKEERKDERAGYEVPGTKGPMVFENYYPESVLDSGKDKDDKNKKEKKKEEDKPIYERTLREW
ncbi:MAG: hypothetical protein QXT63_09135 [Thermoplasmata archaeon]